MTTLKENKEEKQIFSPRSYVEYLKTRSDIIPNAVGYVRTSTVIQHKSIQHQIEQLQDWSKQFAFNLVSVFVDEAMSGTKPSSERQSLHLLLQLFEIGDTIIVSDVSRLTRSVEHAKEMFEKHFVPKKIKIVTLLPTVYVTTPEDQTTFMSEVDSAERTVRLTRAKISTVLIAQADAGKLQKKPSYGWRFDGKGRPHVRDEAEQQGIQFIRELVQLNPTITIPQIVTILNDPTNKVPPHRRKIKAGQEGWYYMAVKNLLTREDIRQGTPYVRLTIEQRDDRKDRVKLKKGENRKLRKRILEILNENPSTTYSAITRQLESEDFKLENGRSLNHDTVRRILLKANIRLTSHDQDLEEYSASAIRELRKQEPKMKVAEIIRRLTAMNIPPLLRATSWNYYSVNKLIKKYKIDQVENASQKESLPLPTENSEVDG